MLLCGPKQLAQNFCRYTCVGPQSCPETDASAPVWAQAATKHDMRVALYRPRELPKRCAGPPVWAQPDNWHRISAGTLVWAHRVAQKLMPVLLCWFRQLPNKICKWYCMGPERCLKDVQVLLCGPRQLAKNFCRYTCVGPQICPGTDAGAPVWAQATTKQDL